MAHLSSSLLLSLLIASSASAVSMAWTPIGNPGNTCDTQSQGCFGAVGYAYAIGTYEVTNAQYAEFLNAKAASDPFGLYHVNMGDAGSMIRGGIARAGVDGSYSYSAIAGRESLPVNWVSFFDALRFANWLNNGQASGDTETGAYTMLGGTPIPSNSATVTRNAGATIVMANENEWYKAAYYDGLSASFLDYPTGSDTPPTCALPNAAANQANCGQTLENGDLTAVGSYTGSASRYGTFDQGGNAFEWNETMIAVSVGVCGAVNSGICRGLRGGSYFDFTLALKASSRDWSFPHEGDFITGFRLAMIPEPGTGVLVIGGLLGFVGWRRARSTSSSS